MTLADPDTLLLALGVAGVGAVSMLRVLTGLVEQETRLHDTKVRVAQLQIGYLERARGVRGAMHVGEEGPVGAADEEEIVVS